MSLARGLAHMTYDILRRVTIRRKQLCSPNDISIGQEVMRNFINEHEKQNPAGVKRMAIPHERGMNMIDGGTDQTS